jgi:hypothetical protein
MPYERKGNCVYKDTGKKVGCSKSVEGAEKYLKALYASEMKEDLGVTEPSSTPQITVAIVEPANEIANFVSTLFASRTQAHIFHLQTTSFAKHKALNEYYDEIVGLTDGIIESYQGRYGIIEGYSPDKPWLEGDNDVLEDRILRSGFRFEIIATTEGQFRDLFTYDWKKYIAELWRDGSIYWCGYISPDYYSEFYRFLLM